MGTVPGECQRQDEWDCQGLTGDQPTLVDQIGSFYAVIESEIQSRCVGGIY